MSAFSSLLLSSKPFLNPVVGFIVAGIHVASLVASSRPKAPDIDASTFSRPTLRVPDPTATFPHPIQVSVSVQVALASSIAILGLFIAILTLKGFATSTPGLKGSQDAADDDPPEPDDDNLADGTPGDGGHPDTHGNGNGPTANGEEPPPPPPPGALGQAARKARHWLVQLLLFILWFLKWTLRLLWGRRWSLGFTIGSRIVNYFYGPEIKGYLAANRYVQLTAAMLVQLPLGWCPWNGLHPVAEFGVNYLTKESKESQWMTGEFRLNPVTAVICDILTANQVALKIAFAFFSTVRSASSIHVSLTAVSWIKRNCKVILSMTCLYILGIVWAGTSAYSPESVWAFYGWLILYVLDFVLRLGFHFGDILCGGLKEFSIAGNTVLIGSALAFYGFTYSCLCRGWIILALGTSAPEWRFHTPRFMVDANVLMLFLRNWNGTDWYTFSPSLRLILTPPTASRVKDWCGAGEELYTLQLHLIRCRRCNSLASIFKSPFFVCGLSGPNYPFAFSRGRDATRRDDIVLWLVVLVDISTSRATSASGVPRWSCCLLSPLLHISSQDTRLNE
ncbi:hypothetical protein B0H19DRAFT_1243931 [Mycena capillaripes]|nr:hypothetical protein B0H19DRAFT_1243931 [Mycena capillaripes]